MTGIQRINNNEYDMIKVWVSHSKRGVHFVFTDPQNPKLQETVLYVKKPRTLKSDLTSFFQNPDNWCFTEVWGPQNPKGYSLNEGQIQDLIATSDPNEEALMTSDMFHAYSDAKMLQAYIDGYDTNTQDDDEKIQKTSEAQILKML